MNEVRAKRRNCRNWATAGSALNICEKILSLTMPWHFRKMKLLGFEWILLYEGTVDEELKCARDGSNL